MRPFDVTPCDALTECTQPPVKVTVEVTAEVTVFQGGAAAADVASVALQSNAFLLLFLLLLLPLFLSSQTSYWSWSW